MRFLTLIFILSLSASSLFAYVGKVAALKGDVRIQRGAEEIKAFIGSNIEESDTIVTNASSRAQLYFKDETVISIGKNSTFRIEGFFFDGDPQNSANNATFNAVKGAFKVMTGKIGKVSPQSFKLSTRTATIGIRGTHFLGNIKPESDQIACTDGKITVGTLDGQAQVLVKAGQITFVAPGEMPTPPREFTVDELKSLAKAATNGDKPSSKQKKSESSDDASDDDEGSDEGDLEPETTVIEADEIIPSQKDAENLDAAYDYRFPFWHAEKGPDAFDNSLVESYIYWDLQTYGITVDSMQFTSVADNNEYTKWGRWDITYGLNFEGISFAIDETLFVIDGTVAQTSSTEMSTFISSLSNTLVTYNGSMLGEAYVLGSDADGIEKFQSVGAINSGNSNISLTMDFGSNQVYSGTMEFATSQGTKSYTLDSATAYSFISGSSFSVSQSNADYSGSIYVSGDFYGPNAEAVGGIFDVYSATGVNADGVFEAKR